MPQAPAHAWTVQDQETPPATHVLLRGDPKRKGAVVDPACRIHGLENAFVADCSICPTIPRANTNLPAAAIGLRALI